METVDSLYAQWEWEFRIFEIFSLTIFTIEYAARLWVVPENPDNPKRLRWCFTPSAIIDFLAVLPGLLMLIFPLDLRMLRAFRMLRLLKLTRYSAALGMLLSVFEEEAGSFFAGFFVLLLVLVFAASGAWLVEREAQPEAFGSIPAAMWWAVATLTTVGYGDVYPVTVMGKVFGAAITVVGVGMAALPAGIIASGLNDQLHRRRANMQKQFRMALEDGVICGAEEAEIETLRKELGLSRRAADQIRAQMEDEARQKLNICPHCGRHPKDVHT